VHQLPDMQRYDWVVDNLKTRWSLAICRLVAQWNCGLASWCGVFSSAVFSTSAHDFATRLYAYLEVYNTHHAHPYRWRYGTTLGASDTLVPRQS
jgi:hypothetical protein